VCVCVCVCVCAEGGAVGQSLEDRRRTAAELRAVFKATGFPFLVVPLEQVSVVIHTTAFPFHRAHLSAVFSRRAFKLPRRFEHPKMGEVWTRHLRVDVDQRFSTFFCE